MNFFVAAFGPAALHPLQRLEGYLPERIRLHLGVLALASLIAGAADSVVVIALGSLAAALESGSVDNNIEMPVLGAVGLGPLLLLAWSATVVGLLFRAITDWRGTMLAIVPMEIARDRLVRTFFSATHLEQQSSQIGELNDLLMNQSPRVGLVLANLATAISAIVVMVVVAVTAFFVDPLTFLVMSLAVGTVVLVTLPVQRLVQRYAADLSAEMLKYSALGIESLGVAREVRTFDARTTVVDRMRAASHACSRIIFRVKALIDFSQALYRSLALILLVTGLGVLAVVRIESVAAAATGALLMLRAMVESQTIYRTTTSMAEHLPFADEIRARVDRYHGARAPSGERTLTAVERVELQAVGYTHSGAGDPLFSDVNATLVAGDSVGVAGGTGQGKSTFLGILLGLIAPTEGTVTVNGASPSDYTRASWADQVSAVPQEPSLLSTTVEENIRFFRKGVTIADVEWAAKAAGIDEAICSWPDGYETQIGSGPTRNLSGGEAQRICIARALAGRPSLLVLDEPTSALDAETESTIAHTLESIGADCIVAVVSHRERALSACKHRFELENGTLVRHVDSHDVSRSATESTVSGK